MRFSSSYPLAPLQLPTHAQPMPTEQESHGWSSIIGICTAICGNILISIALNTQKYAHHRLYCQWRDRVADKESLRETQAAVDAHRSHQGPPKLAQIVTSPGHAQERDLLLQPEATSQPSISSPASPLTANSAHDVPYPSYFTSPYWWIGQCLIIVGESGNFLAYGFAPASVVSPLGVVAMVANPIIASVIMKERSRPRDKLGIFVAVCGALIVVLSANTHNPKLDPEAIWGLISSRYFAAYVFLTSVSMCVLTYISHGDPPSPIFVDIGLVALYGGYTVLATKGVTSLLSYTLFQTLTFPITYLLIAVLATTAIMQVHYFNKALKKADTTQVVPTHFVFFTISVIVGSSVLYKDFQDTSAPSASAFVCGCALTFLGVWLITAGREPKNEGDEGELGAETDYLRQDSLLSHENYDQESTSRRSRLHSAGLNGRRLSYSRMPLSIADSNTLSLERNPWLDLAPDSDEDDLLVPDLRMPSQDSNIWVSAPTRQSPWSRPKALFRRLAAPFSKISWGLNSRTRKIPRSDGTEESAENVAHESSGFDPGQVFPDARETFHLGDDASVHRRSIPATLSSSLSAVVAHSIRRQGSQRHYVRRSTLPVGSGARTDSLPRDRRGNPENGWFRVFAGHGSSKSIVKSHSMGSEDNDELISSSGADVMDHSTPADPGAVGYR